MGINKQLNKLYSNKWNDFLKMEKVLGYEGILNYSSPLLMYCWEDEYNNCNKKLLFVGQETNSWFECGSSLDKNSLKQVITNYEEFELANGYNSPFWRFIKELNSRFNDTEYCYLWTNINKFGQHGAEGRPDPKVLDLESEYFNILKDELTILKPDAVIFLTGPNYDNDIINKLGATEFLECSDHTSREFAQLKNKYLPKKSFRIYHPNYLSHSKMFDEYLDILSKLI